MIILYFHSPAVRLETAGGKGANLARLAVAGFPVPQGFIISTEAYHDFVKANRLEGCLQAAVKRSASGQSQELELASAEARQAFAAGEMPAQIEAAIRQVYQEMFATRPPGQAGAGVLPAAVRSSATAEDLPELSFAGQQDTFLNILGERQLLQAVVRCWSSLWTARAMGYRLRNQLEQTGIALAVVVQAMVPSQVSGVLFTANPLTGRLDEMVIDAVFGLGETLVSGAVEPDHYLVDSRSGQVKEIMLGAKKTAAYSQAGGGVKYVPEAGGERQTLDEQQIRALAKLGQQVQEEFDSPQDIEWALAGGELHLLQSRPITALFPVPEVSFDPLIVWFSFGAVQGLLGPLTPLGQDTIRHVAIGAGSLFGEPQDSKETDVLTSAGERMWIRISDVLRNPLGRRVFGELLNSIEPSVGQILKQLAGEERLQTQKGGLKLKTLRLLAHFFLPVAGRLIRNALHPEKGRAEFDAAIDTYLAEAVIPPAEDRFGRLENIATFTRERVAFALPFLLPKFIAVFGPSMGALNLLNKLTGSQRQLALEVTRGLRSNVTTEMDLALWRAAKTIRQDAAAAEALASQQAGVLARSYLEGDLPAAAQSAVASFMASYGMRGVAEIDIGQTRWREDPTPVMHTLQSYLKIDAGAAPDVTFERGERAAYAAIEALAEQARRQPFGWLKEKNVRAAARRIRTLMGVRESPKFFAIRVMGVTRQALLQVGGEFAAAGTLERGDDLVFLTLSELGALAGGQEQDWKSLVADRREAFQRELRRRQVPRVLASDGRAFYEGLGALSDSSDELSGSPVSPGVVEGNVHVVLDPRGVQLTPGEILVCPGTDPAWTPLFLAAGGLVTEVGGMMTHGSVVAREYGIPAVVGVHQATERLKNGQRIQVNGTTGKIVVLK